MNISTAGFPINIPCHGFVDSSSSFLPDGHLLGGNSRLRSSVGELEVNLKLRVNNWGARGNLSTYILSRHKPRRTNGPDNCSS